MDDNKIHFGTASCMLCRDHISRSNEALPGSRHVNALHPRLQILYSAILATDDAYAARVVDCGLSDIFLHRCISERTGMIFRGTTSLPHHPPSKLSTHLRLTKPSSRYSGFGEVNTGAVVCGEANYKEVIKEGLNSPLSQVDIQIRYLGQWAHWVVIGQTRV